MRGEDIVFDIEINENNYMSKDFFAIVVPLCFCAHGTSKTSLNLCFNPSDLIILLKFNQIITHDLQSKGLVVRALDSQSRDPVFKTTGGSKVDSVFSSVRGR